ncbi:type IV pilus assembly protein PilN [Candidatus Magnetomoraceae bacterium gMMP-15]
MIHINLLPFRSQRTRENVHRQLVIFIFIFIGVIVSLIYVNMLLQKRMEDLEGEVKSMRKELVTYRQIGSKVDKIQNKLKNLKKKMEIIGEMEANRSGPVRLIDAMTLAVVPGRMWFTSLNETKNGIKITGIGYDNKTVADFMKQLEMYKDRFLLTKGFSDKFKKDEIAENVLIKLNDLKKQEYVTEEEFIQALEATIGRDESNNYKSLIIEHAKFSLFDKVKLNSITQHRIKDNNLKKFDVICLKAKKEEADNKKKKKKK